MAVTVRGTDILFNDGTTQSTAASSAYAGGRGQVFTSSGTFTIPTGVTAVKVTVVGGGGASTQLSGCTLGNGNSGGTSSVASGTQTISTISATGGSGYTNGVSQGGLGSGGDINARGSGFNNTGITMSASSMSFTSVGPSGAGNAGIYGAGGIIAGGYAGGGGGTSVKWLTGLTPGNTLSVTVGAGGAATVAAPNGYAGGAGIVIFEW